MTLTMTDITIEFPGVKALDRACFNTRPGIAHALIGANGAGKSTLMKVLSGAYTHYTGRITINGNEVTIRSPKDARNLGIQIVYQEVDTALIPYLTVAENIMLNEFVANTDKKTLVDWKTIHTKAKDILRDLNVQLSSRTLVSDLTLAEKQMVLIARAVSTDCSYLILDEPTAPLSFSETEQLFRVVNDLKKKQVGVVFISHRLPELFDICEQITVMRNGEFVIQEAIPDTSIARVVEQMLGEPLEEQFPSRTSTPKDVRLQVEHLADGDKVKDVTLNVRAGEIIGIAGLVGAGKTELCKLLFGATSKKSGRVAIDGKEITLKTPSDAVRRRIAFVPEERRKEGVLVEESVVTNLTAASVNNFLKVFSFLDFKKERSKAGEMINALGIKTPTADTLVQNLSGGNQQKVAIGKWLVSDADIYIFDEPTKGVDVGAKKDIFDLVSALAEKGKSVIYASCELAEVKGISDRIYVLYDGQITKELSASSTNEEELLYLSTGGK
ncbi:sugar ABC transporter ATP-binding protein [Alteribacter aurantiacus]|uniref:sugar ABC transporter ATP-binding protein n=1 Tax=Alteribacter aurantiacus TaxID=254410 RepID=UPI000407F5C6|nr:sugar ABC transporter ATP-binding protein [Alteribacter aurantiacus]